jgi:thymidine kinase
MADETVTRRSNGTDDNESDAISSSPILVGGLTMYIGPMYAGKTSKLLSDLETYADVLDMVNTKDGVVYINHDFDVRETENSDKNFSTHSSGRTFISDKIDKYKMNKLEDFEEHVNNYDVIGIDEGQFFEDLDTCVMKWLRIGKIIIVAGLDCDANLKPFGKINMITHMCRPGGLHKLYAVCKNCIGKYGTDGDIFKYQAGFTTLNSRDDPLEGQVRVGGHETYSAVCLQCYYELNP